MHVALRAIRYVFFALALAVVLLAGGFLLFAQTIERTEVSPEAAEGVVALTGGKDRIGEAFELLANGQAKRLLITGVHPSTKAQQLQRLVPRGSEFFPCCVDLGRAALDTRGNAVETAEWVARHKFSSLIVVTSTYHMPRTLVEFSREMPNVKLVPFGVVSPNIQVENWWSHAPTRKLLLGEYAKYLNALVKGPFGHESASARPGPKAQ